MTKKELKELFEQCKKFDYPEIKMTPQETALKLCQKIGWSTVGGDFNEGMSLPLEVSKKIAIIMCDTFLDDLKESFKLSKELHPHCQGLIAGSIMCWKEVKSEIEKL